MGGYWSCGGGGRGGEGKAGTANVVKGKRNPLNEISITRRGLAAHNEPWILQSFLCSSLTLHSISLNKEFKEVQFLQLVNLNEICVGKAYPVDFTPCVSQGQTKISNALYRRRGPG